MKQKLSSRPPPTKRQRKEARARRLCTRRTCNSSVREVEEEEGEGEEVSLTCPNKASHGARQREREENKEDIEHGNAYESRFAAENQLGSTDSIVSSSFHARMAEGRGCRKGFASVVDGNVL